MGINVLSLFDGISCGQLALNKLEVKVDNYYASEIEKNSIKVTQENFPNTIQVGDVTKLKGGNLPKIDLILGGSPCQGFSLSGKQLNFSDERSKLFFEYVRLLKEIKPKYFLLENVIMKKKYRGIISDCLKVEPVLINSSLVSAQRRKRLYWTNIETIKQPNDKKILIKDVLSLSKSRKEVNIHHPFTIKEGKTYSQYDQTLKGYNSQDSRYFYLDGKVNCITKSSSSIPKIKIGSKIYKCDPDDVELFQTVPVGYTKSIADSNRFKVLGNGWTVDVIVHILKYANFKESKW